MISRFLFFTVLFFFFQKQLAIDGVKKQLKKFKEAKFQAGTIAGYIYDANGDPVTVDKKGKATVDRKARKLIEEHQKYVKETSLEVVTEKIKELKAQIIQMESAEAQDDTRW